MTFKKVEFEISEHVRCKGGERKKGGKERVLHWLGDNCFMELVLGG